MRQEVVAAKAPKAINLLQELMRDVHCCRVQRYGALHASGMDVHADPRCCASTIWTDLCVPSIPRTALRLNAGRTRCFASTPAC